MPRREKGRAWLFLNGLKVPNRDIFCRITGQALQSSLMVAFFAAVLSEGSGVESYVVAPPRCRVVAFPRRKDDALLSLAVPRRGAGMQALLCKA